jgi:hypothetical protein
MRRFGGTSEFLTLIEKVRAIAPHAGIRSNVIVGFPGETEGDVEELERFLGQAMLDVVGVFGYSDEDGTEAAGLEGKIAPEAVAERVARIGALTEELTAQRALDRVGEMVEVLVEEFDDDPDDDLTEILGPGPGLGNSPGSDGGPGSGGGQAGAGPGSGGGQAGAGLSGLPPVAVGRAAHQGPEVDGLTLLPAQGLDGAMLRPGQVVRARVRQARGVDLLALPEPEPPAGGPAG